MAVGTGPCDSQCAGSAVDGAGLQRGILAWDIVFLR